MGRVRESGAGDFYGSHPMGRQPRGCAPEHDVNGQVEQARVEAGAMGEPLPSGRSVRMPMPDIVQQAEQHRH